MLKSKKSIYILIPLNVLIWSFFIYRFYSAYHAGDELPMPEDLTWQANKIEENDTSRYKLQLNYDDPFLKTRQQIPMARVEAELNQSGRVLQKKQHKPDRAIQKPSVDIKYIGLIKNTETGNMTALLSINGVSKMVKEKEVVEGITFKKFTRDSLIAMAGKDRIVVRK